MSLWFGLFYRLHVPSGVARVAVVWIVRFFCRGRPGRQGAGHRRYECAFARHDCKSADEENKKEKKTEVVIHVF